VITVAGGSTDMDPVNASGSKIEGINALSLDKRVKLNWLSPEGDVLFYSIKYGVASDDLSTIVDTNTSATEWYVPNLENGIDYYFRVFAVSPNGDEFGGSDIIKVSPGRPENTSLVGESDAEITSETGPGVLFALFLSIGLSVLWRVRTREV
jgi:hypothetical protein